MLALPRFLSWSLSPVNTRDSVCIIYIYIFIQPWKGQYEKLLFVPTGSVKLGYFWINFWLTTMYCPKVGYVMWSMILVLRNWTISVSALEVPMPVSMAFWTNEESRVFPGIVKDTCQLPSWMIKKVIVVYICERGNFAQDNFLRYWTI